MLLLIIIKTYTTINTSGIIAIRLIPFISMAPYIKNIIEARINNILNKLVFFYHILYSLR